MASVRLLSILRPTGLTAGIVGLAGSVGLMLRVGRHNQSWLLLALFALWVLSPFLVLLAMSVLSKNWSSLTRTTLYGLTIVIALGSLAIYAEVALGPPRTKIASMFVLVPPVSWLLTAIVLPTAACLSRRSGVAQ